MMTPNREALIAEMFPEPITTYVDALASSEDHPVVALAACLTRYQEAGPLLREILTRAVDGKISTTGEDDQLFRVLHIVGGARDALAFPTLLRFLQGPPEEVEQLLGDAATETLPGIVAGTFDGNDEALFEGVANRDVPGAIRGALMRAAAFLTHEKRIDRQRMIAFLERFPRHEPTPGDELAWFDWTEAIAMLGLRHLEPLVSEAETRGWIDESIFERDEFEKLLMRAEQAPDDGARFAENQVGYIHDVMAALECFNYVEGEDDEWDDEEDPGDQVPTQPVTNPWRHVGRNDPCPCGSGKKAKRCCLAA